MRPLQHLAPRNVGKLRQSGLPLLKRAVVATAAAALLAACALPPPDMPAHPSRMGRFFGLVARCGCIDVAPQTMIERYAEIAQGLHDPQTIAGMRGYVESGAGENYDNQIQICREVCSQTCMIEAVAEKIIGRTVSGAAACLISERDLHLTSGRTDGDWP